MHRRLIAVLLALTGLLLSGPVLTGCGDSPKAGATTYTSIIDVRTPAEYAAAHVEGAVNLDVEDAGFGRQIATLAKDGTYLVYCRSGNRAGTATATMKDAGLDVTNGGGLADMKAAGYAFTN